MNTITEAAVAAADSPKILSEKVMLFVQTAKGLAVDGLSLSDFGELLIALLRLCVSFLDSIPETGEAKKAYAMEAVALLYDELIDKIIPIWAWPVWMMLRPVARPLVMALASGAIESLLPLVRLVK
jgi:hypothetical protein